MGVLEQLSRKSGVIVGDDVLRLFEYAKEKGFAIPAIVGLTTPQFHPEKETRVTNSCPIASERDFLLHRRLLP